MKRLLYNAILPLAHRSASIMPDTLVRTWKIPSENMQSPLVKRDRPGFKTTISSKAKQLSKQSETFGRRKRNCSFYTTLGKDSPTSARLCGVKSSWKRLGIVLLVQKQKCFTNHLVQVSESFVSLISRDSMAIGMEGHSELAKRHRFLWMAKPFQIAQKFNNSLPCRTPIPPRLG